MKVGLIGYGGMGRTHASLIPKHADVSLVAIADATPEKCELAHNEHPDAKIFTDGAELISSGICDVIFVCSPTYLHHVFAIQALKAGCDVFSEKPMATSVELCTEMTKTAEETGKTLMIGQVLRFWPEYVFLKNAIESKKYGELRALSMTRVGGVSTGWQNWFLDENRGGMQIFDRHIHDTDAILWMLGKPVSVQTRGAAYDTVKNGGIFHSFTSYIYPKNLVVSAEGSADTPKGFPFTAAYRAFFENACLEFNSRNNPTLLVYEGKDPYPAELPVPLEALATGLNITTAKPYFNEQAYFFDCLKKGIKPQTVTPEAARETIKVVKAEIQSARSSLPVTL